jgi:hypothetical protein
LLVLMTLSTCIALAGGLTMSLAKIPLYRQGRFFTLGCGGLDQRHTRYYRVGFRLAAIGIVAGAVLVIVLCMPGRPQ